jgi:uncharacterized protein GlcG (DUF336 family)
MMSRVLVSLLLSVAILSACSSGSSITEDIGTDLTTGCTGNCQDTPTNLVVADVQRIISQAVAEAQARNVAATIAVIDRVGNVLALYRMSTATPLATQLVTRSDGDGAPLVNGGLEGITLPFTTPVPLTATLRIDAPAAIAKAITATYFSTEGSAISTRTASQLIQDQFNPGEANTPGGPLFGVPFSNLACSELTTNGAGAGTQPGPGRSPLGYAGDPGGFPLYKNGTVVGGIGVLADGRYSIDTSIVEADENLDDEAIAVAGTFGFGAPVSRRADRLGLDGKTGRYTDVEYRDLRTNPATAPAFAAIPGGTGALVNVTGYGGGTIIDGTAFGTPASGIRPATVADFPALGAAEVAALDAFVIVDGANANRYRPSDAARASTPLGGNELTPAEVQQLLASGLRVASRTRSAIRFPYGSKATMSVVVVDHLGKILGIARTRDATIEGAGVALQKTRNAAFLASADAASFLAGLPAAQYIKTTPTGLTATTSSIGNYVLRARTFFAQPTLFGDGQVAWSSRAVNNITHPNYPDGIAGAPPGPFSRPDPDDPADKWSVFNPGLPLDISLNAILQHLLFIANNGAATPLNVDVTPNSCAGTAFDPTTLTFTNALAGAQRTRLGDGIVLKPGGFPIYRNGVLVGAFGAAGDGTEQDDIVGFLGLYEGTQALIQTGATNAPGHAAPEKRVDQLTTAPGGVRTRYVVCPQSPFVTGNSEGVCNGK